MKRDRQTQILKLISQYQISTQEELADRLIQAGFHVTQATVSRDIRDLRLVKVVGLKGGSHYVVKGFEQTEEIPPNTRFNTVLQEAFVSSDCAGNLLVVKTATGMAMAVAASIDALEWNDIIGSIAGDDTIFLAVSTPEECQTVKARLDRLARR